MTALLEIDNLSQAIAERSVFQGVKLRVEQGDNLLITGPSGCGKSTLLRLVAGLEAPVEGTIRISGELASNKNQLVIPPHKRSISMVFQDLALWPNLSALDNVMLGLYSQPGSRSAKLKQARIALDSCGVAQLADRRPYQLSGGEQQRVAIARALATSPKLLLLDEPFAGIDLVRKTALVQHIQQLCESIKTTVITVSHDLADANLLSARIAVLEDGGICDEGTIAQLESSSRSRTLEAWKARSICI